MNALEDTRELVTTTSAPDTLDAADAPWRKLHVFVAGFVEDLLSQWPDVELSMIRITDLDGVITVTGRRGPLTPIECPSCHTHDGHPHTDYCTAENRDYPGQPGTRADKSTTPDTPARGQWLRYVNSTGPDRVDHRDTGGTWHPVRYCRTDICGATPADAQRTWDSP